jgi:hypothetical protein
VPRSLKPLLAVLVFWLAWSVVHALVGFQLDIAIATQRRLGSVERAIVSVDLELRRWLPFFILPAVLAPAGSVVAWWLRVRRPTGNDLQAAAARSQLKAWSLVLAGAVLLGLAAVGLAAWSKAFISTELGLGALLTLSWSYAGALYDSLWLQQRRNERGDSTFKASTMAVIAFVAVNCAPLHLLGTGLPLWVLWASRGDPDVVAGQASSPGAPR